LANVAQAARSPRRLPRPLHRRKQKRHQAANDGDHHQQFDKRETM
jgi:hypothetical protein